MNARSFLVRGLLVGLLAGVMAFLVAHQVGEPHVERAIALEEAGAAAPAATDDGPADGHTHEDDAAHSRGEDDEGTAVSRGSQRTWGLATGTLTIGLALGGILALVSAGLMGRLGRLTPRQSTATVALVGFTAFALVPFLKYPATPPAVGSGDTIGSRTGSYFLFVAISLLVAVAAVALARRLWEHRGAFTAVAVGTVGYVAVMVVVAELMPTVNELGAFPADTLWGFRLSALFTLATMWGVLGLGLTWAVGRLHEQAAAVTARRELAASL